MNLTCACKQIIAQTKKEAEALYSFLPPHEVYAEIRGKKDRILFVNKKVLTDQGLNDHLFLGKRDGFKTEIVGTDVGSLIQLVYRNMLNSFLLKVPITVAAVGKFAESIYKNGKVGFNSGEALAPLIVRCTVIPTHTTTEVSLYTDAVVLNEVAPAVETGVCRVGPSDLRDSAIMRSISAAALEEANRQVGAHPGKPEHIKVQKKVRNEMARGRGYSEFDGSLIIPFEAFRAKFTGHEIVNRASNKKR
jgi:hypothetical protein